MGYIAVDLTEVSSLTVLEEGNNFIIFFTLILKILIFQQYNYNNSSNWNISPLVDVSYMPL